MRNNNELFHSDVYLGKDYSDGIKHWKYVKRVKLSNGKYRYYYEDSELDRLDKERNLAERKVSAAEYNAALKNPNFISNQKKGIYYGDDTKVYDLNKKAKYAHKQYRNYALLTMPRIVINTGIAAIANVLQKFKK